MQIIQNRRTFLAGAATAGFAALLRTTAGAASEPPPETTTIRMALPGAACNGPLAMIDELLHEEGFLEVRRLPSSTTAWNLLPDGDVDIDMMSWSDFLPLLDAGRPMSVLSGIHAGCLELRANDSIHTVADLRGKRVGINNFGVTDHMLVSLMAAYVGLRPANDIDWVVNPDVNQVDLFKAGKVDAFIGFPPEPKQACERDVGHVVVNTAQDRPWSQYFCCMALANSNFARANPVATKRALRALLKSADICHHEPERVAQRMTELGFSQECAVTALNDARYGLWREYDPEDTVRFFALRLNEIGIIKKAPNEIIAGFTDWHFLQEIKSEMKI